jgi:uncharacterized integral membrane protein (TIGR00697 family)
MKKEQYTRLFIILCSLNITFLLISNIVTVKTINIFGLIFTAGDLLFPFTYILNDIFTEVYGFNKAKFVIWISFFCNLIMVIIFGIVIWFPEDKSFTMQREFQNILGNTPRILLASFISYLLGNFTNSIILSKIKVKTKGKYLGLRTVTSTLVGEGLDTLLFIPIAFLGKLDLSKMLNLMLNVYILKVTLEIILTPITYIVIGFIKRKEDIDAFDENEKYKILK